MDGTVNDRRQFEERDTREETRSQISGMRHRAEQKAEDAATQARGRAEDQASRQKDRAAGQLHSISSALRETSASLHDQEQDAVAGIMENAATQVERLSGYLGSRTVSELVDEAQDFARREPALFLGGAFLLGLVGARFMKSSDRHHDRQRQEDAGYRRSYRAERMDWDQPAATT